MRKVFYFLPLLFCSLFSFAQIGSPDPAFNGTGTVTIPIGTGFDEIYGLAKYSGNKIVAVGLAQPGATIDFVVARYNEDGTPDATFGGGDGVVTTPIGTGNDIGISVAIQADGKIVVVGYADMGATSEDIAVVRYEANGDLDLSFGGGDGIVTIPVSSFEDQAYSVAIQPADQKIVIGGTTAVDGGNPNFVVIRLETNGDPDLTFDGDGIAIVDFTGTADNGSAIGLQADGSIIISGWTATGGPTGNDIAVARLTNVGALDATFGGGDGKVTVDGGANTDDRSLTTHIPVLPDGDFYVAGNSETDFMLIRFDANGTPDAGFDGDGIAITNIGGTEVAFSVAVQSDNKPVLVGLSGANDFTVVRYLTNGALDASFGGGDGISTTNVAAADNSYAIALTSNRIYVGGSIGAGADRDLVLIALQNDASALPVTLLSFAAQKQNNNVAVTWKTEKEDGILQYVVEHSADGKTFAPIGQVTPSKTGSLVKDYSFIDTKPLAAMNYYRLAIYDVDATIKRSKIVALKFNKQSKELEIYQNPVVNNQLRMQLPDGLTGRINIRIVDATGRIVKSQALEAIGGSSISTTIDVSTLGKGVYFINILSDNGKINKQFLKN